MSNERRRVRVRDLPDGPLKRKMLPDCLTAEERAVAEESEIVEDVGAVFATFIPRVKAENRRVPVKGNT